MFLPLDIDMQTLEILHQNGGDTKSFLEEMYADGVNYLQQYKNLCGLAKQLSVSLQDSCGRAEIRSFFVKLSEKTVDAKKLINHDWGFKDILSFHDWYCALVNILRGGELDD